MSYAPRQTSAQSEATRQKIRSVIQKLITSTFGSTLATCPDIVNIVTAQLWHESSFNYNARGPVQNVYASGTGANQFFLSGVISNVMSHASAAQIQNIKDSSVRALGLSQSMGWNHVRGASRSGKCLMETVRGGQFASRLCVSPGEDPGRLLLGEANIENSILTGLLILEDKWNNCRPANNGTVMYKGTNYVFPSRIYAALSAYLGLGSSGDSNHTTFSNYASSILWGNAYKIANGASAPAITLQTNQYATTNAGTNSAPVNIAGCLASAIS